MPTHLPPTGPRDAASTEPAWTWQPRQPGQRAEIQARGWLGGQLGMAADEVPLTRDLRQRPAMGPPLERHDCSWSHSGDGLAVALGVDVRIGIDLEWQRPRPGALALARRYFSRGEAECLAGAASQASREHLFLRLWCAKEAVLKAHGHGLSFGLHRLEFEATGDRLWLRACDPALGSPGDWRVRELVPAPGYLGALAWRACRAP